MNVIRRVGVAAAIVALSAAVSVGNALADSRMFHAYLYGGNEVPTDGDPEAFGIATVLLVSQTKLCYSIIVKNVATPTAAHIHPGPAGVSGPPLVNLNTPTGTPPKAIGCVEVAAATVDSIRANPQDFYINVHNGEFPGGAARGQLQ